MAGRSNLACNFAGQAQAEAACRHMLHRACIVGLAWTACGMSAAIWHVMPNSMHTSSTGGQPLAGGGANS